MLNKVTLIGHLGQNPDIRHTQSGDRVATFTLATGETWKDKTTGERKERTEWHKVVVFNEPLIKLCEQYVKKGSKVFVEGQLATRKWQDKDGTDRYSTDITLRPYKGNILLLDGTGGGRAPVPSAEDYEANTLPPSSPTYDFDDEIPF